MERATTSGDRTHDAAPQPFREQADAGEAADPTTLDFEGRIRVSSDDDLGGDPYNHTGRFRRNVR